MTVPKLLLGPYVLGWWRKVLDKEQGTEQAEEEEAGKQGAGSRGERGNV